MAHLVNLKGVHFFIHPVENFMLYSVLVTCSQAKNTCSRDRVPSGERVSIGVRF